jgi:4-amino-4-deoxy-L-arabinose transferase-like glycosyltransferase
MKICQYRLEYKPIWKSIANLGNINYMNRNIHYQFWIIAFAAIIFFTCLGATSLWDEDETLYASIAQEMHDRGDWVVPMFNGHLFPEKPPLMFWLMIAGFELFGQNEFGARFFSALLGMGTALITYHLGRLLFNSRIGLWSGLIAASSIFFTVSARAATVDSALVFVSLLALLCFVAVFRIRGTGGGEQDLESGDQGSSAFPRFAICNLQFAICNKIVRYGLFVLFYICLGIAVLAKGPVGFMLPMAALCLFLMIVNSRDYSSGTSYRIKKRFDARGFFSPMNFLRSLWQLRPITAAAVVLAVALPWYLLVGLRSQGVWLEQFFAKFNLRPFMQPILGHSGPFWLHIPYLLIGFFPWSVFLGPTIIEMIRRIRDRDPRRDGYILLACWFGVFFLFWSICSTKLPHYLLPVYPTLAIMTGCFLETWIKEPSRVGPSWMKNAWITTMAVGLGIIVAVGIAAWIYLPGEELVGLVGLILIIGGYFCLYYAKRRHRKQAITAFACMAAVFLTAMFGFAAQRVDQHQNAKRLLALIRGDSPEPATICAYRFFRQGMVYYAGHPIQYCDAPEQLLQFLEQSPQTYVITLDKYADEVEGKHPGGFRVLARERRFLATDQMVVLAPAADADSSHTAKRPQMNRK